MQDRTICTIAYNKFIILKFSIRKHQLNNLKVPIINMSQIILLISNFNCNFIIVFYINHKNKWFCRLLLSICIYIQTKCITNTLDRLKLTKH